MANVGVSRETFFSQVDEVRVEIKLKFDLAHKLLDERERDLLSELQHLEGWYRGGGINDEIEELNQLKELQLSTTKINKNKEIVMKHVSELDSRVRKVRADFEKEKAGMRRLELEWDREFETRLSVIGKIRRSHVRDYKETRHPEFAAFKHSAEESERAGVFHIPRSIAIDSQTDNVFICDCGNNRVQVFDNLLQFLFDISDKMHRPDGICISDSRVYVTQNWDNCLNLYNAQGKFFKSSGKEGKKKIKFDRPRGVAVSIDTNLIYVCDLGNNRVQCLNLDLTFNSLIPDIPKPQDVKLTHEKLVVLTGGEYCILYYNYSRPYQKIMQLIPRGEHVNYPWHFCLDSDQNILMTEMLVGCVVIFTNRGELVHKFGKEGEEKGEFKEPTGIAIDSQHRIIVVSENPKYCIQLF